MAAHEHVHHEPAVARHGVVERRSELPVVLGHRPEVAPVRGLERDARRGVSGVRGAEPGRQGHGRRHDDGVQHGQRERREAALPTTGTGRGRRDEEARQRGQSIGGSGGVEDKEPGYIPDLEKKNKEPGVREQPHEAAQIRRSGQRQGERRDKLRDRCGATEAVDGVGDAQLDGASEGHGSGVREDVVPELGLRLHELVAGGEAPVAAGVHGLLTWRFGALCNLQELASRGIWV